jgi:hypothetical protein
VLAGGCIAACSSFLCCAITHAVAVSYNSTCWAASILPVVCAVSHFSPIAVWGKVLQRSFTVVHAIAVPVSGWPDKQLWPAKLLLCGQWCLLRSWVVDPALVL